MTVNIFGTKVKITYLFVALLTVMFFTDKTGLILPTVCAVILHESAHLIAMHFSGCAPKEIVLIPGSVQIINSVCYSTKKENLILIAGPLCNIVFSAIFLLLYILLKIKMLLVFSVVQFIIAVFNLLPARGLDGGALVMNYLERIMPYAKAQLISKLISFFTAFAFLILGWYYYRTDNGNLSIFIFAAYIFVFTCIKN